MHAQPQLQCHPSLSLFLIGMLTTTKQDKAQWESILFQPVLKAYLMWHSWIITAHISLGNLNKQLHMFNNKKALAHELLKLQCQPFTSNIIFNALLGEFSNINSIYQSYKSTIQMAKQLLQTEPVLDKLWPTDSSWPKRSLLSFMGDVLQWLTETATTKDTTEINWQINLPMQEQTKQRGNFSTCHFHPRHYMICHPSEQTETKWDNGCPQKSNEDVNILFYITGVLTQHLIYHPIYTYACTC